MSKPIALREADFKRDIWKYSYPEVIKTEFFDYWSEPDRAPSPKMRFEKEKTWHMGRRLARWVNNSKTVTKTPPPLPQKREPVTDVEKLDAFIDEFRKPGSNIPFEKFEVWYDWMKKMKLLKPMYQHEIDELMEVYEGDKSKCRCAVVQKTLMGYINNGLRVSDLIRVREKINQ